MNLTMDFTNTGKLSQFLYHFTLFFMFLALIIREQLSLEITTQLYRHTVHLYIFLYFFLSLSLFLMLLWNNFLHGIKKNNIITMVSNFINSLTILIK
jgi:hypothetical protein